MADSLRINQELLDNLTAGDLEDVEDVSGIRWASVSDGAQLPMRAIRGLAWVIRRRTEPKLTFDACRAMTPNEMFTVIEGAALGKPALADGMTPALADA